MRFWLALCAMLAVGCGPDVVHPQLGPDGLMAPWQGGMRPPVVGRWRVHRTHYGAKNDQAWAVDLVIDGGSPSGRGRRNEDFGSYNQPIVAAAPGVVVIAADGIPDNEPPRVNPYDMHGNYVVIDHRNGEYSLYAHLIPGSLRVWPGQVVAMGQELGRCGNSGRSTRPHLHFQVQSHWLAHRGKGLPVRHEPYLRNGHESTGRMEKGDTVESLR